MQCDAFGDVLWTGGCESCGDDVAYVLTLSRGNHVSDSYPVRRRSGLPGSTQVRPWVAIQEVPGEDRSAVGRHIGFGKRLAGRGREALLKTSPAGFIRYALNVHAIHKPLRPLFNLHNHADAVCCFLHTAVYDRGNLHVTKSVGAVKITEVFLVLLAKRLAIPAASQEEPGGGHEHPLAKVLLAKIMVSCNCELDQFETAAE